MMQTPEVVEENNGHQSTSLLQEILVVLKRIDGHLEAHEERLSLLDVKLSAISPNFQDLRVVNQGALDGASLTENIQKEALPPPVLSKPGWGDLKIQVTSRNDSFDNRSPQASVASAVVEKVLDHEPHYSVTHQQTRTARNESQESSHGFTLSPKDFLRTGTWGSIPDPPVTSKGKQSWHETDNNDLNYTEFPPPRTWISTRTLGRLLEVKSSSKAAQSMWRSYLGDSWTIPPDGRIELTFQRHLLERLDEDQIMNVLQALKGVSTRLEYQNEMASSKRGSFRVTDFGFDQKYEESAVEYRAEVPTGKYKKTPITGQIKRRTFDNLQSAPWKRMIEIRGLSKKIIDEHETWTRSFRNPWTEALPIISDVCPFFTDRQAVGPHNKYTSSNLINQALLHHQQCWRQPPPCEDTFAFHITFYEIVDLTRDDELDGEIWRSGKLHSDNEKELATSFGIKSRRIRESACTIVVVPDPRESDHWTSVYLCPNSFNLYDKTPSAIQKQNASDALMNMIDFTVEIVIERWRSIEKYFTWLIGHRNTLSDPDAHDSLLFDDDTFSRSRRYFWAINYLAEMDMSISENIAQLERRIGLSAVDIDARSHQEGKGTKIGSLPKRLGQLKVLKARLRTQRDEAIALRDGLFSASGVMESRASTRLGENIKLLTFVSIFFLPLSFCMSIWSVSNTLFSLKALAIVAILVGLGTYLIVFNLNNMVSFCNRHYDRYKKGLIVQMKTEHSRKWSEQGKRFATFRPKKESLKPSEWIIALYVLHKFTRRFRFHWKLKTKQEATKEANIKIVDREDESPAFVVLSEIEPGLEKAGSRETGVKATEKRTSMKGGFALLGNVLRRGACRPLSLQPQFKGWRIRGRSVLTKHRHRVYI